MNSYKNDKLDKIYKSLPKLECKLLCQQSCGLITTGVYEKKRIEKKMGEEIFLSPEEMLSNLMKGNTDFTCSLLKEGKCEVYKIRPLICRLFGLVKKMACPFGCIPERWLSDEEAKKLLKKAGYFDG